MRIKDLLDTIMNTENEFVAINKGGRYVYSGKLAYVGAHLTDCKISKIDVSHNPSEATIIYVA